MAAIFGAGAGCTIGAYAARASAVGEGEGPVLPQAPSKPVRPATTTINRTRQPRMPLGCGWVRHISGLHVGSWLHYTPNSLAARRRPMHSSSGTGPATCSQRARRRSCASPGRCASPIRLAGMTRPSRRSSPWAMAGRRSLERRDWFGEHGVAHRAHVVQQQLAGSHRRAAVCVWQRVVAAQRPWKGLFT